MFGFFKKLKEEAAKREKEAAQFAAEMTASKVALEITEGFAEFNDYLSKSLSRTQDDLRRANDNIMKFDARTDTNASNIAVLSQSLVELAQAVGGLELRLRSLEKSLALNNIKFTGTKPN